MKNTIKKIAMCLPATMLDKGYCKLLIIFESIQHDTKLEVSCNIHRFNEIPFLRLNKMYIKDMSIPRFDAMYIYVDGRQIETQHWQTPLLHHVSRLGNNHIESIDKSDIHPDETKNWVFIDTRDAIREEIDNNE